MRAPRHSAARRTVVVGLAACVAAACAPEPAPSPDAAPAPGAGARIARVSERLQVAELAPGLWLHTSWSRLADGTLFPSNGLIVRDGDGLLLVDGAWGEEATEELLRWIDAELELPVRRAVATHWHDDRLGGARPLLRRGAEVFAHPLTRRIAGERGLPLPEVLPGLGEPGSVARLGPVEVFYPGPGHALDNVVVWHAETGTLFGGCAVRAAGSTALGNLEDADTAAWPDAIRRTLERYGSARRVVPGHGEVGDVGLLRHTLSLFRGS